MIKNAEAKSVWERLKQTSQPGQLQHSQRKILKAFLLDPECSTVFLEHTAGVCEEHHVEEEEEWISRKQLLDLYEESEAEEMLETGALQYRKHPKNPKRMQFKFERAKKRHMIRSTEALALRSKQDLDKDRAALAGTKMAAIQLKVATGNQKMDKLGLRHLLREHDDEEENPEPPKKKQASRVLRPEKAQTELGEEEDIDVSKLLKEASKCKTQEQELKVQLEDFKSSVYATKAKCKGYNEALEKLQSVQTKLDPRKLMKLSEQALKAVADEVATALQTAKDHIKEIKKLKQLESGSTKAYSTKTNKK